MYIIYPSKEKDWRHLLLLALTIGMLIPLLKFGGFFGTQLPDSFEPIPSQAEAQSTFNFTKEMVSQGNLQQLFLNYVEMLKGYYKGYGSFDGIYPLYPSLLVTVAQNNFDDFSKNAIGLNFILLFVLFVLLITSTRRTEGEVFALILTILLLLCPQFIFISKQFGSTLVLLISSYLCWFNLVEQEELEGKNLTSGLWAGVAFLTAPFSGILFLSVMLYFILHFKLKLFKERSFYTFLLGFVLVASPILVRDCWLHLNPFYSIGPSLSNLSLNLSLLFQFKWISVLYLAGLIGLILDRDKKRKALSFILMLSAFLSNFSLLLMILAAFYAAGLVNVTLTYFFKKQIIWIGIIAGVLLCVKSALLFF